MMTSSSSGANSWRKKSRRTLSGSERLITHWFSLLPPHSKQATFIGG
jgi:hypothetical protein